MPGNDFPKPVIEIVMTLADIFRHQHRGEVVELLENAGAKVDAVHYDNWDGGTTTWALRLEVPVPIFAIVESRLIDLEKELLAKLGYFGRLFPNDPIGEVTISPISPGTKAVGRRLAPSESEVRRIWPQGYFRLFLSHVSEYKVQISDLKGALAYFGVAGFVAHENIEPSLEWQREIETALRSMHALAAFITPDFPESVWTDQEVGWAFGRELLVIPVRLGKDPYGFAGKVQGLSGNLDHPQTLASSIAQILLKNPQTHHEMRRAIISAFGRSTSFDMAISLAKMIVVISDITEDEKNTLWDACKEGPQVSGSIVAKKLIYGAFGKPPEPPPFKDQSDIPF